MDINTILTLVTRLICFMGLIFLGASFAVKRSDEKKRENCTFRVMATAIDSEKKIVRDGEGSFETFYPTWQYEYKLKVYERKSSVGYPEGKISVGQKRFIYLNPDAPLEIYDGQEIYDILIKVFAGVGVGLFALGIILRFAFGV